ncbi:MAG: fatty acid--CoA ligase family protein, partial [Raoultibacter sp.]
YWNRGLRLLVGYGMSESGPNNLAPSIATELEQNKKKPLCIGRPMAFTEAAIVDDSDKPVEPGTPGNLLLRGALSFSGYWNDAAATEQAFVDGWVRTGDIGYRDDEGDYYICGRKKNMYISGGENIFPTEIERCLLRCPGVREACVIGVSDEHWGEVGKALIVPEDNTEITIEIIKDFLEDNISAIKRPRYVELVSSIPKNTLGKRDERTIRACYGNPKPSGDCQ